MRIILASQSPRRRELLERMGVAEFDIIPAQGEEVMDPSLSPDRLVEELSRQKCAEVAAAHPDGLVIAADTVVSCPVAGPPRSTRPPLSASAPCPKGISTTTWPLESPWTRLGLTASKGTAVCL